MAQVGVGTARRLYDLGYTDLVSVIPPGAELTPGSNIKQASLGKVPGMNYLEGWAGYGWQTADGNKVATRIDESGANIGLRARHFPGLDIDSASDGLTVNVHNIAREILGEAPIRLSSGERRMFVYRTDAPFKKKVLEIMLPDGSSHAVEMLGDGQQYLIVGKHPSGSLYRFQKGHSLPKDPGDLPLVHEGLVDRFFKELAEHLHNRGAVVSMAGSTPAGAAEPVGDISAGARNDTLASVAGTLQRRGLPASAIYAAVWETNLERCNPPLESGEVQIIVDSVTRYEPTEDLIVVPASEDFEVVPGVDVTKVKPPVFIHSTTEEVDVWEVPDEEWLLEDIIPIGGSSLLVAKPKVGKSTFARAMAVAMARGEPFLDRKLEPTSVMYVMFPNEGTRRETQAELRRLGAKEGLGKRNFHFYDQMSMEADKKDVIEFLSKEAERIQPGIILIDTLQGLVQSKDLNDYSSVHAAFRPIREVAEPYGAHLCYLHHAGKGDRIDLIDLSLGSTALAGSVTVVLAMKRDTTEDTVRLFAARGRGVEFPPHVIHIDRETHEPSLGLAYHEYKAESLCTRVLGAMANQKKPLIIDDVRVVTGANKNDTAAAVKLLVESGALVMTGGTGRGDPCKYAIPSGADEFEKQELEE